LTAHNRLPHGVAAFNELYGAYKKRARLANREFELTKEQFKTLTSGNCFYCNRPPMQEWIPTSVRNGRGNSGNYIYNGIDRIDSSKGYTLDNCSSCCSTCNYMKQETSREQFLNDIEAVYSHITKSGRRVFKP